MVNASTMYIIKVGFRESQVLLWESSSGVRKVEDTLENVMISAYRKTNLFVARVEKE